MERPPKLEWILDSTELIIFGDIAGRYDELMEIMKHVPEHVIPISVGDMNDRGKDSKKVFDYFMAQGFAVRCNHGHLLIDAYRKTDYYQKGIYLLNGGLETINSFISDMDETVYAPELLSVTRFVDNYYLTGSTDPFTQANMMDLIHETMVRVIPEKYIEWLEELPFYLDYGKLIITHASINPSVPFESLTDMGRSVKQDWGKCDRSLLWNRGGTRRIINEDGSTKFQVHGHMSQKSAKRYRDKDGIYGINIDTSKGKKLTGYCWPTGHIIEQEYLT